MFVGSAMFVRVYVLTQLVEFYTLLRMKVTVNRWNAVAQWRWDVGQEGDGDPDEDSEEDLCGICRVSYDGCCPTCKVPGDDCPLSMYPIPPE